MPIYAIFEVKQEGYDDTDVDILIGYVESEEAAIRICDNSEQEKIYKEKWAKYLEYCKVGKEWDDANKHKFVNVNQIKMYIESHQRVAQRLHNFNCSPPNISKIPEDRREKVMAAFINKRAPFEKKLADLSEKIKNCLDLEKATAINEALKKERADAVGEEQEYPDTVYKRRYELAQKLD